MLFSVVFSCFLITIGEISCLQLFNDPIHEIAVAKQECKQTEPQNVWSCALDKSKLFTPSGNAIDPDEFGPWMTPLAEKCFTYTAKPNNEEAEQFAKCLFDVYVNVTLENHNICYDSPLDDPVENLALSIEAMDMLPDHTCYVYCMLRKFNYITDDDKLNIHAFNSRLADYFNLEETVVQCEIKNEDKDKCRKFANFYFCMSKILKGFGNDYDEFRTDYIEFIFADMLNPKRQCSSAKGWEIF